MYWHLAGSSRSLRYDSSEDPADDDDLWTSLKGDDYAHLGVTVAYQVVLACTIVHLYRCRKWPPYQPRQINLVCMTGLAGILAYIGTLIAFGVIDRHDGDFIAHCGLVSVFDYAGWGMWLAVALVRVYRSWKILVKHSVDMWPAWRQVALLTVPHLIPAMAYSIDESLSLFNERRNWCEVYEPIDKAIYLYDCIPILFAFGLVYQMRKIRKQMNEFRMQVLQLLFLLITGGIVFPLQDSYLNSRHEIRRIWVLYHNVLCSLILFWPPIAEPLYRYLQGNEEYLRSYTKGFSTLPTPAQMRSSLKDQLSLEDLRREFGKFAELRVAKELPDFYKACLDREEIEDFFERQAATTAIIDRFVRPGAEQEVNLSFAVREKILTTEVTSYNIFNDAMSSVLNMMETNFSVAFQNSEAYQKLELKAKREAEELERLRQMNQLPSKDHVQSEANLFLKLVRRAIPGSHSTTGSDRSSSASRCSDDQAHSTSTFNNSGPLDVLEEEEVAGGRRGDEGDDYASSMMVDEGGVDLGSVAHERGRSSSLVTHNQPASQSQRQRQRQQQERSPLEDSSHTWPIISDGL